MKKNEYSEYGSFSLEKINAPKGKCKNSPKSNKIEGKGDLRSKVNK